LQQRPRRQQLQHNSLHVHGPFPQGLQQLTYSSLLVVAVAECRTVQHLPAVAAVAVASFLQRITPLRLVRQSL
jgi:hypothetical protein